MGVRSLRRYAVTGERFTAREALRLGLVHEICPDGGLDEAAAPILEALLQSAPEAVAESKLLLLEEAGLLLSEQQVRSLALQAAAKRASPEAAEGLRSFHAKRAASGPPALDSPAGGAARPGSLVAEERVPGAPNPIERAGVLPGRVPAACSSARPAGRRAGRRDRASRRPEDAAQAASLPLRLAAPSSMAWRSFSKARASI